MESKTKIAGHAIHPMLIVFPLGLLAMAVIFDVITIATTISKFSEAAFYMISAGVFSGLLAAIFGIIDWVAIPQGTRAKRVATWHGIGNVFVMLLFSLSCLLRWDNPGQPSIIALMLSFAGAGVTMITAWLGGELVERLGVGIYRGANVNASSSFKALTQTPHRS
jgi:uncharacterized membrane protein